MTRFASLAGRLATASDNPSNPIAGDEYYNTRTNSWMRYDGAGTWRGIAFTGTSTSTSTTTTSTSTTTTSSTTTSTSTTTTSTSTTTTSTSSSTTTTSTSTTTTV